jgi:hypothetical protein
MSRQQLVTSAVRVATGSRLAVPLELAETVTPATPGTGSVDLYAKNDHKLYIKDSTGLESPVGGSSILPWSVSTGHLLVTPDNTYDIGASGATRPRNLYLGGVARVNGFIANVSGPDAGPYTQKRIVVYEDVANWGYFAYGSDAQLRIVYGSSTGAALLFGRSTATNNTGAFTQTASLDGTGNLSLVGSLTVAAGITTGAISSSDWFRVSSGTNGLYSTPQGQGINFVPQPALYPSGDLICGLTSTQTLSGKTYRGALDYTNLVHSGFWADGAASFDLGNATTYANQMRAYKAWGTTVTLYCSGSNGIIMGQSIYGSGAVVIASGDAYTFIASQGYWWVI